MSKVIACFGVKLFSVSSKFPDKSQQLIDT